ncbi:MAG TPA: winged helix-turn-helix domain-containing protein [Solirubrobacterales bacterium]|nr:winged helix-turn-helix domain-containing protein [Solirubrobacterales bacterium]
MTIKWDENGKREIEQNPSLTGNDATMMKALSHPVRARALTVLNERVASPSELAAEQEEAVGYVAYHVRVLREMELIELVKSRQVRGATEHFYRGTIKPYLSDDFWEQLPKDARRGVSVAGLDVLNEAIRQAFQAGTFDARIDRHLSNLSVNLDEQGWREASTLLEKCLMGLIQVGAEAEARDGQPTMRATFGLMGFESPAK